MNQGDTRDLIITRLFDAPRELVWKAWTEPERVMRWWGPIGFTSPVSRIDLRVGGEYQSCMRSPDGKDFWSKGIFREIVAPEKSIESGKNVPQFEFLSDREVVITRIFDAPRDLVFKASTDPDHIPQWWGPKRFTTKVEKMDVNPGGVWRFIQRDKDGNQYAFNGVYREIVPPEREVHTFEFEGMPGHVILETSTFKEFEGKTKLTVTDLFQSVEDRDGMFNSGMKEGATESMDRLEEIVLKTLKT
jgi:uncharacterized protein YndB with AHSA1/START domain